MAIDRSYVIDILVHDFDQATDTFSKVLGRSGHRMVPEANPTGELDGMHWAIGGINALGIMALKGGPAAHPGHPMADFLNTHGDGICILGHLVDDIDQQVEEFKARGVPLATPEPTSYSDGRLVFTAPIRGSLFEFAEHHDHSVTDLWDSRRRADASPRLGPAYRIDVVVDDLDAATKEHANLLGLDPAPSAEDRGPGVRGVDFPIGGLDAMGLIALEGSKRGPVAEEVAAFLERSGQGGMIFGFTVDDLDRVQGELTDLGIGFVLDKGESFGTGRSNLTKPVHGVTFELTERR
jgi:catechol 2,3-dioxygenase-like lactoylglutathione lyase family enzyme